jgi:hypothetical protein
MLNRVESPLNERDYEPPFVIIPDHASDMVLKYEALLVDENDQEWWVTGEFNFTGDFQEPCTEYLQTEKLLLILEKDGVVRNITSVQRSEVHEWLY